MALLLVPFCGAGSGDDEPGERGHGEGAVGVPGTPVMDLAFVEAGEAEQAGRDRAQP